MLITDGSAVKPSFDNIVDNRGLQKIKTIGDAYMAAAGLPVPVGDHAVRAANMALDMIEVLKHFNRRNAINLDIRIGLNSGPVVAGIIGTKKFSYDLWGDTVNVASRMESHSLPGMIQVSGNTHELLADKFVFEERGTIDVKNRGLMATYCLIKRKDGPAGQ